MGIAAAMTQRLSLDQFQRWMMSSTPQLRAAGIRGMRAASVYLHRTVALEIGQAEPRPAVDTGELRNSVNTTMVPDGAIVSVDAPHAGVLEYGRRPGGRKPPLQPLIDWLLRHPELLDMKAARARRARQIKAAIRQAAPIVGRKFASRNIRATHATAKEVAARSAAFALQRSIARKGIAPRGYFAKAWSRSERQMMNALLLEIARTGWKPTAAGRLAIATMFGKAPTGGKGGAA